jgi:hypothetical protein
MVTGLCCRSSDHRARLWARLVQLAAWPPVSPAGWLRQEHPLWFQVCIAAPRPVGAARETGLTLSAGLLRAGRPLVNGVPLTAAEDDAATLGPQLATLS